MNPRIKISVLVCFALLFVFSFTGCKNKDTNETTTDAAHTTAVNGEQTTDESQNARPVVNPVIEETTTDSYKYTGNGAVLLGEIYSDIYGLLTVHFESNHICLIDDFGEVKFTFPAEGYSTTAVIVSQDEKVVLYDDMDFDGYADLRIIYRKDGLNSYYLCWLWNMATRTYDFFEPLSAIPSPQFNTVTKTVVSYNRANPTQTSVVNYQWQNGELNPISHSVVVSETEAPSSTSEDVQTAVSVFDGMQYSYITLFGNKNSQSRWLCKIENEKIVRLNATNKDENTAEYRFTFRSVTPGTTTVVLRYATDWNADYIAEKVLNITVNADKTMDITVIE